MSNFKEQIKEVKRFTTGLNKAKKDRYENGSTAKRPHRIPSLDNQTNKVRRLSMTNTPSSLSPAKNLGNRSSRKRLEAPTLPPMHKSQFLKTGGDKLSSTATLRDD
jgi:hypothetical protein